MLAGITQAKAKTPDEVHSDLLSSLSLLSETELLVEQVESGRVSSTFRVAHADYLREESLRNTKELHKSAGPQGNNRAADNIANQLELLAHELERLSVPLRKETFSDIREQLQTIRKSLLVAEAQ
jgi:hypothetical protein